MKTLGKKDSLLVRATETISSPSHCLRELIENSLDAGATIVTIRVSGAGLEYISVSDNGPGISEEGLRMICEEGVTSKIFGTETAGGRGRALESIAMLSFLKIESSTTENNDGYRLQFNEDGTRKITKITRTKGTTSMAQTLFYGHPVRRHFFLEHKHQQTQEINDVISAFALATNAKVTSIIDNKNILNVVQKARMDRISSVYGPNISKGMETGIVDLSAWYENSKLEFFTSSPTAISNSKIVIVINGRPCTNAILSKAIRNEFRLCAGPKSPSCVLYFDIPRESHDFVPGAPLISVAFQNEKSLIRIVCESLNKTWQKTSETPTFKKPAQELPITAPLSPIVKAKDPSGVIIKSKINFDKIKNGYEMAKNFVRDYGPSYDSIETAMFKDMEIIGQWNRSFIITRLGCDIYAIDQHAACEAQNFEKLRKDTITKQTLLQPYILHVSPAELESAEENREKCSEYGFDFTIEDDHLSVTTIPAKITVASGVDDLLELLSILKESPGSQPMTSSARKALSYRACHSSVVVGDAMSNQQMKALLDRMGGSDFPWNCPHGRPTWCQIWSLLEKEDMCSNHDVID